jgi:hypothetical protein
MSKKWIQDALSSSSKEKLHNDLGVPEGKKIPRRMIMRAKHSSDPKLARRARLADTLSHFHHRGNR